MSDIQRQTEEICKKFNIKPTKKFGQNFLIDGDIYENIINAAKLITDDEVLEVGPGLGFLTIELAKRVKKVTSVEIDDKLVGVLRARLNELNIINVEIVNDDILKTTHYSLNSTNYKVVANLPYNITSVFLRKFLTSDHKPSSMTLLLQKEVVDRMIANPGKMSLLGISAQLYANVTKICDVGREAFYPAPAVDSAVVHLDLYSLDEIKKKYFNAFKGVFDIKTLETQFFRLAKIGFAQKRKKLKNNLSNGLHIESGKAEAMLDKIGLSKNIRAQELAIEDWVKLVGSY